MADVYPGVKAGDTHITGAFVESHSCILTSNSTQTNHRTYLRSHGETTMESEEAEGNEGSGKDGDHEGL